MYSEGAVMKRIPEPDYLSGLQFSADLKLTQDDVKKMISAYLNQHGKSVTPSDITFNIKDSYRGGQYETSTPGSFTTIVKIKL